MVFWAIFLDITSWMELRLKSKAFFIIIGLFIVPGSSNAFKIILMKIFHFRNKEEVLAKMNVVFDKEKFVKGRSLEAEHPDSIEEGDMVKRVIRDSIAAGRVGSLTVDPQYLDFEPISGKKLSHAFLLSLNKRCNQKTYIFYLFSLLRFRR